VEVEVIETARPRHRSIRRLSIDAGAAAVQKVEEAKAAADAAIEEAAESIEEPAAEQPSPVSEETSATTREPVLLGDPALTAGVPGSGPITLAQIDEWLATPKSFAELQPILPLGLSPGRSQITGLDANPLTRAKIELGRQLILDPRLSVDSTVSCASCHNPAEGYSAHTKTGIGIRGQAGGRNSPVSFNRILSGPRFWMAAPIRWRRRLWARFKTRSRWASPTRAW